MTVNDKLMKLRIETSAGDINIDNVQEYVCGKQYFYINVLEGPLDVKVIKREIINEVYRSDGKSEWKVNLKTFKLRPDV
jgi:hypothetical protein